MAETTEVTQANENGPGVDASPAPQAAAAEDGARFPSGPRRIGFLTEAEYEVLLGLGEEPDEYNQLMQSLHDDLRPQGGLEGHLVRQMGETLWRMRRTQRMRDGLALRSIQTKVPGEEMLATIEASQAFKAMEPYERLQKALAPRGQGPSKEEIQEFVKRHKDNDSERMQEFLVLLESLIEPGEGSEQQAAQRKARKELAYLMEGVENLAWRSGRKLQKVQSAANLAAMMAPEDEKAAFLQRMEETDLRKLWRLINALEKIRQGGLQKKKKYEQTGNVYENKGPLDKMPD